MKMNHPQRCCIKSRKYIFAWTALYYFERICAGHIVKRLNRTAKSPFLYQPRLTAGWIIGDSERGPHGDGVAFLANKTETSFQRARNKKLFRPKSRCFATEMCILPNRPLARVQNKTKNEPREARNKSSCPGCPEKVVGKKKRETRKYNIREMYAWLETPRKALQKSESVTVLGATGKIKIKPNQAKDPACL